MGETRKCWICGTVMKEKYISMDFRQGKSLTK